MSAETFITVVFNLNKLMNSMPFCGNIRTRVHYFLKSMFFSEVSICAPVESSEGLCYII